MSAPKDKLLGFDRRFDGCCFYCPPIVCIAVWRSNARRAHEAGFHFSAQSCAREARAMAMSQMADTLSAYWRALVIPVEIER
jgi:hypothetical protein